VRRLVGQLARGHTVLFAALLGALMFNPTAAWAAKSHQKFSSPRSEVPDFPQATRSGQPVPRSAAISPPRAARAPEEPGSGVLLIARQKLRDPNFLESVVLLVEYGAEGALGLIINRPTGVALAEILPENETLRERPERLYEGGPVQRNQIFLLIESQQALEDAIPVMQGLYMSASASALQQLLQDSNRAVSFRAYAGYAGWGPGQLDAELDRGDWQLWWADRSNVFSDQGLELWQKLLRESSERWVHWQWLPESLPRVPATSGEPRPVVAILTGQNRIASPGTPARGARNLVGDTPADPRPGSGIPR